MTYTVGHHKPPYTAVLRASDWSNNDDDDDDDDDDDAGLSTTLLAKISK